MEPKPSGSLPAPVLVPAPVNLSPRSRNLMALKTKGPAHFSTDMGRRPPRDAFEFMAVAVRSDPEADRDKMIESLRKNFPLECRLLTPTTAVVQEYFDGWDIKYHNYTFLYKVFQKIAGANAAQSLALTGQVQDVAARWRATNEIAFRNLSLDQCLEDVFTPHDIEEHGLDIIVDVWKQLQQEKVNEDHYELHRLQAIQAQMNLAPETLAGSQALETTSSGTNLSATASTPSNSWALQGTKAPVQLPLPFHESGQQQLSSYEMNRALTGQNPGENRGGFHGQDYYPLDHQPEPQRMGSASREFFRAPDAFPPSQGLPMMAGPLVGEVAHQQWTHGPRTDVLEGAPILPQGFVHSGPSTSPWGPGRGVFQLYHPSVSQRRTEHSGNERVPISRRPRVNAPSMSQGIRNPKKRTSDDARVSATAGSHWGQPPDPASAAWISNPYSNAGSQHTGYQTAAQEILPRKVSSGPGQYWENHRQNLPDGQDIISYPGIPRASSQSHSEFHADKDAYDQQRITSNPYASDIGGIPGGAGISSSTLTTSPQQIKQQVGEVGSLDTKENPGYSPSRGPNSERFNQQILEHTQIPPAIFSPRPDVQTSYIEQPSSYHQRRQNNQLEAYDYSSLWIGNMPMNFTEAQRNEFLGHSQGLAERVHMKTSANGSPTNYMFINFPNPVIASEALTSLHEKVISGPPDYSRLIVKFKKRTPGYNNAQATKSYTPPKPKVQKRAEIQSTRAYPTESGNKRRMSASRNQGGPQNIVKSDNEIGPACQTAEKKQHYNSDTVVSPELTGLCVHGDDAHQNADDTLPPKASSKSAVGQGQSRLPSDKKSKQHNASKSRDSSQLDGQSTSISARGLVERHDHKQKTSIPINEGQRAISKKVSGKPTLSPNDQTPKHSESAKASVSASRNLSGESSPAAFKPTSPQCNEAISTELAGAAQGLATSQERANYSTDMTTSTTSPIALSTAPSSLVQTDRSNSVVTLKPATVVNENTPPRVSRAVAGVDPESLRLKLEASTLMRRSVDDLPSSVSMQKTLRTRTNSVVSRSPGRTDRPEIPIRTSSLIQFRSPSPVKRHGGKQKQSTPVNDRSEQVSALSILTSESLDSRSTRESPKESPVNVTRRTKTPSLGDNEMCQKGEKRNEMLSASLSDSAAIHKQEKLPFPKTEKTASLVGPCEAKTGEHKTNNDPSTESSTKESPHHLPAEKETVFHPYLEEDLRSDQTQKRQTDQDLLVNPVTTDLSDLTLPNRPVGEVSTNIASKTPLAESLDQNSVNTVTSGNISDANHDEEYHISEGEKQKLMDDHFADTEWRKAILRDIAASHTQDYQSAEPLDSPQKTKGSKAAHFALDSPMLQSMENPNKSQPSQFAAAMPQVTASDNPTRDLEHELDMIVTWVKLRHLSRPSLDLPKPVSDALKKAQILLNLTPRRSNPSDRVMVAEVWDKKAAEFLQSHTWRTGEEDLELRSSAERFLGTSSFTQGSSKVVEKSYEKDLESSPLRKPTTDAKGEESNQDDEFPRLPNVSATNKSKGQVDPRVGKGCSPVKGHKKHSTNGVDTTNTVAHLTASNAVGSKTSNPQGTRKNGDPWALPNEEAAWGADGKKGKGKRKASKSFVSD